MAKTIADYEKEYFVDAIEEAQGFTVSDGELDFLQDALA